MSVGLHVVRLKYGLYIAVNAFLQSVTTPNVYACGDASDQGVSLTPEASYQGQTVAHNLFQKRRRRHKPQPVPAVVFSIPPIAQAGLSEADARKTYKGLIVKYNDTTSGYASRRINEPASGYKILIEPQHGHIVGAHLLGEGADETINLFALAINNGISADALNCTLLAHHTHGSDIRAMVKR